MLAAKQHVPAYYRQRDGIVKSVPDLIRTATILPNCVIGAKTAKRGGPARPGGTRIRK